MLIRSTRGCAWNRCRFCGIYPALGQASFSIRPVAEVKADIDWYSGNMPPMPTAFVGDADPLCRPLDESLELLAYLRAAHSHLERVTAYARASTIYRLGSGSLRALRSAGLDRVHIGLESGDLATLKLHFKGQSPTILMRAGQWLADAGIEISFYVLLGLGGLRRWREHIDGTVGVVNRVGPQFVRVRRIWLFTPDDSQTAAECPLWREIRAGRFTQQTPEGTVLELRRLVAGIDSPGTRLLCDHANNYVAVEGSFPGDKDRMLGEIDSFLALPEPARTDHYRAVGSAL